MDFNDFTFTDDGDYVIDRDPLDTGSSPGWDLMLATKASRERRRSELTQIGTHPTVSSGSMKQYYLEVLSEEYPKAAEEELLSLMEDWGYQDEDNFEAIRQNCRERAKTVNPDWTIFPECGMDLETLIGEDMILLNAEQLRELVYAGLTYDNMIDDEILEVTFHKGDPQTLLFLVQVGYENNVLFRMVVPFSFVDGPYLAMKEVALNARTALPSAVHS